MSAKALALHQMNNNAADLRYDNTRYKVQVIDAHRQAVIFRVYRSSR